MSEISASAGELRMATVPQEARTTEPIKKARIRGVFFGVINGFRLFILRGLPVVNCVKGSEFCDFVL
jgi:hypothetical protein